MHQDAHEFLNYLLNECIDILHKEWKRTQAAGSTATPPPAPPKTFVHKIFEGTLTNETKCLCCETVTRYVMPCPQTCFECACLRVCIFSVISYSVCVSVCKHIITKFNVYHCLALDDSPSFPFPICFLREQKCLNFPFPFFHTQPRRAVHRPFAGRGAERERHRLSAKFLR